jgi:hypothetical protein
MFPVSFLHTVHKLSFQSHRPSVISRQLNAEVCKHRDFQLHPVPELFDRGCINPGAGLDARSQGVAPRLAASAHWDSHPQRLRHGCSQQPGCGPRGSNAHTGLHEWVRGEDGQR